MGSKEDWEELEKWQKEQKLKEEGNRRIERKEYNVANFKNAKIFSRICNFITKSISVTTIAVSTIIIIIALLFIYLCFNSVAPIDTVKYLGQVYRGEKFSIIEDYSDKQGKGLYILSPKKNKDIQFKAYNAKSGIKDDYSGQRLKYYIENCEEKSLIENFHIEEKNEHNENIEFLLYNVNIEVNNYSEIKDKVEKVYKIAKYLNSKDKKMYEPISIFNRKIEYYFSINCDVENTLEQEIYRAKYEYIKKLKEKSDLEELNQIGQEEIENIYKPESLLLIINGKQMKLYNNEDARVYYDLSDMKYHVSGTDVIMQQIDEIEVIKIGRLSGNVKKIKYNNKVYKVNQSTNDRKNKKMIYSGGTLEEFVDKFQSEIVYDYSHNKVYVTIK